MHQLFCTPESDIYQKSTDNDLYYLRVHLYEFHTKRYARGSKVKKDLPKWNEINNQILQVLHDEFQISDLNLFF